MKARWLVLLVLSVLAMGIIDWMNLPSVAQDRNFPAVCTYDGVRYSLDETGTYHAHHYVYSLDRNTWKPLPSRMPAVRYWVREYVGVVVVNEREIEP